MSRVKDRRPCKKIFFSVAHRRADKYLQRGLELTSAVNYDDCGYGVTYCYVESYFGNV